MFTMIFAYRIRLLIAVAGLASLPASVDCIHTDCSWVPGGNGDPEANGFAHWCTARKNHQNVYYCDVCGSKKRTDPCTGDWVADWGYLGANMLEFRECTTTPEQSYKHKQVL